MTVHVAPEERFWAKVERQDGGCWLWTAFKTSTGYGRFGVAAGHIVYAHRYAHELLIGPIPEGKVLDHLCRVRHCVNPAHLEVVTNRENLIRGVGFAAAHATTDRCPAGHPYDDENTYVRPLRSGRPGRGCRTCRREVRRAQRRVSV